MAQPSCSTTSGHFWIVGFKVSLPCDQRWTHASTLTHGGVILANVFGFPCTLYATAHLAELATTTLVCPNHLLGVGASLLASAAIFNASTMDASLSTVEPWPLPCSRASSQAWVKIRQREHQHYHNVARRQRLQLQQFVNPKGWIRGALFLPDGTRLNGDFFELVELDDLIAICHRRSGCKSRHQRANRWWNQHPLPSSERPPMDTPTLPTSHQQNQHWCFELYGGGNKRGPGQRGPGRAQQPVVHEKLTPNGRRTSHHIEGLEIRSPSGSRVVSVQPRGPSAPKLNEEESTRLREDFYISSPTDDAYLQDTRKDLVKKISMDDIRKRQKNTHDVRRSNAKKRLNMLNPNAEKAQRAAEEKRRWHDQHALQTEGETDA